MTTTNKQLVRLLKKLDRGPLWKERSEVTRWLGRNAGLTMRAAEDAGVMICEKRVRKNYVAAIWRLDAIRR